jgi:nitrogen PTS system EIIA component
LNTIARLLWLEDILLDMDVSNKRQLFDEIGRHMAQEHAMRPEWVTRILSRREQAGSTGLGEGFAIPHARVPDLDRMYLLYVRVKSPIPFAAPDGKPVSDILVILVPGPASEEHLRILADATQTFSDHEFRESLPSCQDAPEVKRLLDAWSPPP